MFQTFDTQTHKSFVASRVSDLRKLFCTYGIDGYFVPRSDEFGNEYLPECSERLRFISGFTGSWGMALILRESANLFIDSRYVIQAPKQTDTDIFDCVCVSDTPLSDYFKTKNYYTLTIGYDASLHTQAEINRFTEYLEGCILKPLDSNLIDMLPNGITADFPDTPIIIHHNEYAGITAQEKINAICTDLEKQNIDSAIITLPESLCWLLNVRGSDVPHTPYVLSYGIIYKTGNVDWFVGTHRIDDTIKNHLPKSVTIYNRADFYTKLNNLKGIILNDAENSPAKIQSVLQTNKNIIKIINQDDPCLLPKAIKNDAEIKATTNAHIRDGAAIMRFACWLQHNYKHHITEIDCVKQLEQFRRDTGLLRDISFDTIAGTGANGAIVHYRVTEETNQTLKNGDLFLLDSGGQYLDGTTDITRTFAIGTPTEEMIKRYTQVLKGHIALSTAKFPEKTTGAVLDSLARQPLWQAGIDFGHGTGHGVGLYLCVHEGPQSISPRSKVDLKAGMILSNEPGYYKQGAFGIRIENLQIVTPPALLPEGEKPMMGFETLTMACYEKSLIDKSLLTTEEVSYINNYHAVVLKNLLLLMTNDKEREFLENACLAL
jgi:Xaa-Pro aminopeptidase